MHYHKEACKLSSRREKKKEEEKGKKPTELAERFPRHRWMWLKLQRNSKIPSKLRKDQIPPSKKKTIKNPCEAPSWIRKCFLFFHGCLEKQNWKENRNQTEEVANNKKSAQNLWSNRTKSSDLIWYQHNNTTNTTITNNTAAVDNFCCRKKNERKGAGARDGGDGRGAWRRLGTREYNKGSYFALKVWVFWVSLAEIN